MKQQAQQTRPSGRRKKPEEINMKNLVQNQPPIQYLLWMSNLLQRWVMFQNYTQGDSYTCIYTPMLVVQMIKEFILLKLTITAHADGLSGIHSYIHLWNDFIWLVMFTTITKTFS